MYAVVTAMHRRCVNISPWWLRLTSAQKMGFIPASFPGAAAVAVDESTMFD